MTFIGVAAACGNPSGSVATAPRTNTPPVASGSIEGRAGYPADADVPMAVYAVATDSSRFFYTEQASFGVPLAPTSDRDWGRFRLVGIPPGDYFVMEISRDPEHWEPTHPASGPRTGPPHFFGGYTKGVQCGLQAGCDDHGLVAVHVEAGQTVTGVDTLDWYAAWNYLPKVPDEQPWQISYIHSPWYTDAVYADPRKAAQAAIAYSAQPVDSAEGCQPNRACGWVTDERDGESAAYVVTHMGTNGLFRTCPIYMRQDARWHLFSSNCQRTTTAFPTVGGSGQLGYNGKGEPEPKCVNFHTSPDLTSKVLTCLPIGTTVTLDDGPAYVPQPSSNPNDLSLNYWWRAAGKGWVVHHYLMWSS